MPPTSTNVSSQHRLILTGSVAVAFTDSNKVAEFGLSYSDH
jgi:hypothetical protein